MKIIGWLIFIVLFVYTYFINRDIGVNIISPIFRTIFPWIGGVFVIFLIGYANSEKLEEWLGRAKSNSIKLEKVKDIRHIPIGWAWLIVVVIVVTIFFYWFSIRPEQIRKDCYRKSGWDYNYNACLRQQGLE